MGDYFVCSKTDPVVETKAGKVRGFRLNTTYAFHGKESKMRWRTAMYVRF